ncbi:hypothetical protein CesoFtcFv8_006156 [Champsocephalus esox]|uniref:Uncharacterized protein n=1 Tax=Champsocephalus esox TaxID=159716 RepID=A0AAN8H9L6_9TELE|nr:hypothetical protein CesoFtcFv8_006156 [Champsocephalus esox]
MEVFPAVLTLDSVPQTEQTGSVAAIQVSSCPLGNTFSYKNSACSFWDYLIMLLFGQSCKDTVRFQCKQI